MLIATSSFGALPAALFAATNPSLTYTNSAGEVMVEESSSGIFFIEKDMTDVSFDSGTSYLFSKNVYFNSGIVTNLSMTATGNEQDSRFYSKSTVAGTVSLSGASAYFANNGGTISSGTTFSLNNSTFEFMGTGTQIWQISDAEISSGFSLISGEGTVRIRNTTLYGVPTSSWLRLEFESEEILRQTKVLSLLDRSNITTDSGSFMGIEISVNGWTQYDYSATLDWDPSSANFGKITITHPIPEPSAFGFVAGTLALALVLPRRRLKVFNG